MASVYRRMDKLSAISYRGLSLGISMAPVLLWADIDGLGQVLEFLPMVLAAAVLASIGNWFAAIAYSKLPVGVANALCMASAAIVVTAASFVFLAERLTSGEMFWGGMVLVSVFLLGTSKSPPSQIIEHEILPGLLSCLGFGMFLGSAFTIIGSVSREMDPLAAGYLWEFLIGLCGATIAIIRGFGKGRGLQRISLADFGRILIYSSPTAIGTGCFTVAVTLGAMGVATAILSTMMVASTVLSRLIFKERISTKQWVLLLLCYLMTVGLKLTSA